MIRDRARIELGNHVIGRIEKGNKIFEMLLDSEKAWAAKKKIREEIEKKIKKGDIKTRLTIDDLLKFQGINIDLIFESFSVFEDLKRGKKALDSDMQDLLQTTDPMRIGAEILLNGQIQWTQKQREEESQKKMKQIINLIAKNAINPQNKKPHPPERIEKAIEQSKVKIDIMKNAEEQVEDIVKAIRSIIPIRIEQVQLAIKIPSSFAAKGYNMVARYGAIKKEEWQSDGSWVSIIDLPAGLQAEFLDKMNKLTHGRVQIKPLK